VALQSRSLVRCCRRFICCICSSLKRICRDSSLRSRQPFKLRSLRMQIYKQDANRSDKDI
jgi:hypothetical protein